VIQMSGTNHRKTTSVTELVDYITTDQSHQAVGLYVSDAKGDDTNGDGGLYNPFKTIDAAIAYSITQGLSLAEIILDITSGSYTATIPDTADVSISSPEGLIKLGTSGAITSLKIGAGCTVALDNLYVSHIYDQSSVLNTEVYIEECLIGRITASDGSSPSALDVIFSDTLLETSNTLTDVGNMTNAKGTVVIFSSGKVYNLTGMSMANQVINDVADPTSAQHAATKNYVDTNAGGQTDTVAGSNGITNTGDNVDAVLTPTYGTGAGTICEGDDSRLSDDRKPTIHHTVHENGDLDEIDVTGLSGVLADDQHIIDSEAVSAMGVKADSNPLNHDKPTNLPPTIIQDSEATESSTSATSWQQAKRFTKTLETAKYLVMMYAEIKGSYCSMQVQINDTTTIMNGYEYDSKYSTASGFYYLEATAGSYNFDFDYMRVGGYSGTVYIKNLRIVLIKVVT